MSGAELASVDIAFEKVALSTAKTCGADFPVLTLDVTTPSGTVHLYVDDFYSSCPWDVHVGRTFVTGLGKLGNVLAQISEQ